MLIYHERPEQIAHGRSFDMSDRAIRSGSLFWYEQPERFAHSHSFVLSDLRKLLTVAHLIWAKWVNEQKSDEGMSDERMSEFPALPVIFAAKYGAQEGQHTFSNLACYFSACRNVNTLCREPYYAFNHEVSA